MPTATDAQNHPIVYKINSVPANMTFSAGMQSQSGNIFQLAGVTAAHAGSYSGIKYIIAEGNFLILIFRWIKLVVWPTNDFPTDCQPASCYQ